MTTHDEKILQYMTKVEELAQEILSDKHEIVILDKRRNQNREALRELKNKTGPCWVTIGSVLIKKPISTTIHLLETDQKQYNIDINKLRSNLKIKVNNLRDLEMQPPVLGSSLVPMSQKEKEALSKAGLFQ